MYYNPTYMNPIMKGLNQGQPQQQEPLEGIASLAPTQPTQQIPEQVKLDPSLRAQPTQPIERPGGGEVPRGGSHSITGPALVQQMQGRMLQQDIKPPAFMAYFKDVMDTGGYPTKTMQEYNTLFPNNSLTQNPLPPLGEAQRGFPVLEAPITPYVQNENLDLTNRGSIMDEYNKYLQGGLGSNIHTADMATGYSFMGEEMGPGSSTGFGDFRNFLDTYGIGDRLQRDTSSFGAQPLQQTGSGLQGLAAYQSQQNTGPGI